MPIYEFRCTTCHYMFEKLMTIYDDYPACPLCSSATEKIISSPVSHFRGKGFYCTDYGKRSI